MTIGREKLSQFRINFADVKGFYHTQSEAVWSFLLTQQNNSQISGNFLELGVYHGRSSHLAAQFLSNDEICILVDINDISEVSRRMGKYRQDPIIIQSPSHLINKSKTTAYHNSCRLIHIDGDHSGHAVITDLNISLDYIGQRGIICIDDYYSARYPQITAATYKWMDLHPDYRMIMCGFNKAYLVHVRDYDLYDSLIRQYLQSYMDSCGEEVSLSKTTYAHDMGCWGIIPKAERPIVGRDQDPDDIPY